MAIVHHRDELASNLGSSPFCELLVLEEVSTQILAFNEFGDYIIILLVGEVFMNFAKIRVVQPFQSFNLLFDDVTFLARKELLLNCFENSFLIMRGQTEHSCIPKNPFRNNITNFILL